MASNQSAFGDIIHLNVGGTRFSTSRQTLTWVPDTFFTSLLSGRISSSRDENNAIFIDRDPILFSVILNFLRTKDIDLRLADLTSLRHEAEYYGITPLVKRLGLCEDLEEASCGDVLFHGYLPAPAPPFPEETEKRQCHSVSSLDSNGEMNRPGTAHRLEQQSSRVHSRNPSLDTWSVNDFRFSHSRQSSVDLRSRGHSRNSSLGHSRNSSWDLRSLKAESVQALSGVVVDPLKVTMVRGHHNWLCVTYAHFACCFRLKDSTGWHLIWCSPYIDMIIERIALNAKVLNAPDNANKMVALSSVSVIRLWSITDEGDFREIGTFNLNVSVDSLFFIGSQLVALSQTGKVGVWHAMTQHWQIQDVVPITSFDTAGSFLLLGCNNGSIYYIDMQKFPLRMKDNDLLVTELYRDPSHDMVTALSVYLTPKTSISGNWIEIAYGTSVGTVRVIVQHPETVGHGPQLFQTFTVHRSKVTKVMLSEKHLVSVCSEYNHVRTWSVTRFRGMISTQPGSTPLASFKVISLEDLEPHTSYCVGNDFGPFGEQDDKQVFIQKVVPETDQVFIRLSSNGQRVCLIKSVDGSSISAFCVHECEGSSRMGSRPRRYLFTGHSNGSIQMWDLTTALDNIAYQDADSKKKGGPTASELIRLLDQCDLSCSRGPTPCVSPAPSMVFPIMHQPSRSKIQPILSGANPNGNGHSNSNINHNNNNHTDTIRHCEGAEGGLLVTKF